MKRIILFFTILSFVNLFAQTTVYRIKLNAYKYKNNALRAVKQTNFDTYILKTSKYYNHYTGTFLDKTEAIMRLEELQNSFKSAYIIKTIEQENIKKTTPIEEKNFNIKKPIFTKTEPTITTHQDYYKIGKSFYNKGDYENAFITFDKLLINEPNNQLARLEYARVLYMLGFYDKSKVEFETVLKTNPPTNVQNNIKRFLQKIDNKLQKNSFYGSIGISVNYDDNLAYNTDNQTTLYGNLELQNDTNKTKGFYETIDLSINYLYTNRYFSWNNKLYTYNEFQNEDIDNLNYLSFITTPFKKFKKFQISLPISVSNAWLDGKTYSFSYLLTPTLNFIPNKTTNLSLSFKHQKSDISHSTVRDYTTNGIRVSALKILNNITLHTSGAYEQDKKEDGKRYDISRDKTLLSANIYYQLFKKTLLGIGFGYRLDKYIEMDPVLGYKREDKKYNYSAFIKQQLFKNGFVTFNIQRIENNSNINTYSYEKNNCSISYNHNF